MLLNLNVVQLNEAFIDSINKDIHEFRKIHRFLKSSERYHLDYLFKIAIDVSEICYYTMIGETERYADQLDSLLLRIENSGEEESLVSSLSILANAYSSLNRVDKAIFCYMKIIQIEKVHAGFNLRAGACYHNIGQLYRVHGDLDSALKYSTKALELITEYPPGNYKGDSFWVFLVSELGTIHFTMKNEEKGMYYYNLLLEHMPEEVSVKSIAAFYGIEMSANYLKGDLEGTRASYRKILGLLKKIEDNLVLLDYTVSYYHFCTELGASSEEVISVAEDILNRTQGVADYSYQISLLNIVIKHYLSINRPDSAKPYIKMFANQVDRYCRDSQEQNKNLIDVLHDKYFYSESLEKMASLQKNLKEGYDEITKKNKDIEELYNRLDIIDSIGKDVTDSDNVSKMFRKSFNKLKNIFSIDKMVSLGFDEEIGLMKPEYVHNFESDTSRVYPIKLETAKNFNRLIQKKETLIINDIHYRKDLLRELEIDTELYKSVILTPIMFKSHLISFVYFLSTEKAAYRHISKEFVIQISIFMAIAINNIRRDESLKAIIKENRRTKKGLEKVNEQLSQLSKKDALTGVNNRLAFYDFYRVKMKEAEKFSRIVSIYMVDIDFFKAYNDHFGHPQGDEALIRVAKTLTELFSGQDEILARYGGEEFIAFSIDESAEAAYEKGEKMRRAIEALDIVHPKSECGMLTVSVGIFSTAQPKLSDGGYVGQSDAALYRAKREGRNRVVHSRKD